MALGQLVVIAPELPDQIQHPTVSIWCTASEAQEQQVSCLHLGPPCCNHSRNTCEGTAQHSGRHLTQPSDPGRPSPT